MKGWMSDKIRPRSVTSSLKGRGTEVMEWGFEEHNGMAPQGRLVLIAEKALSDASRARLRNLLGEMMREDEVTMVSGMNRASVLQAGRETDNRFYNRDYITPEQAVTLMPWREIWLVAAGKVWRLESAR